MVSPCTLLQKTRKKSKKNEKIFYPDRLSTMKRISIALFLVFIAGIVFFSCAGLPPETPVQGVQKTPVQTQIQTTPERVVPEEPRMPEAPDQIMGNGRVSEDALARFLGQNNPEADPAFVKDLAVYYVEEAAAEGVNHDTAFAQMCLETGFLRYGGLVSPDMNNFCGLGSTGPGHPGEVFPDPRTGVRAHIQHLKAYASEEPLAGSLVDPRFHFVRRGSSPAIEGLAGTWAADLAYSGKIGAILERLYQFSFG
jgi:hypothetical protein